MPAGNAIEPFRELTEDKQTECLLRDLRRNMPDSVHVVNMIVTLTRWRREGCTDMETTIYRAVDEGDDEDSPKATAVVLMRNIRAREVNPIQYVFVHSTDADVAKLTAILERTAVIPWTEDIVFGSVHERCLPAVLQVASARGDPGRPPFLHTSDKMFMPFEEALRLDTSITTPGLTLRPLRPEHADFVDKLWPYREAGSAQLLRTTLEWNAGLSWGVFAEDKDDADPVAFVVGQWYGGLGVLHTMEGHRRKGLGLLVTKAASKAAAERYALDAHCNIECSNYASEATLKRAGFRRICESAWVVCRARAPPKANLG